MIYPKYFFNIGIFQAMAMIRRGLFYTYLTLYLRYYLDLSITETTFMATFPMILNVVFQTFVWGKLSDKHQKRRTYMIVGEILAGIGTFIVWYLHTQSKTKYLAGYTLIIGLTMVEIFWSMSNIGWTALISDLYPENIRTSIQGGLSAIGSIGRIVGVVIGGLAYDGFGKMYDGWGFKKGFLFIVSSLIMFISIIPLAFIPEGGVKANRNSKTHSAFIKKDETENKIVATIENKNNTIIGVSKNTEDLSIVTNPSVKNNFNAKTGSNRLIGSGTIKNNRIVFILFLLSFSLINFGRNSIFPLKSQYLFLKNGFAAKSNEIGYIVNMFSLGIFIFGFVLPLLVKKISDEKILMLGTVLASIDLIVFVVSRSIVLIYISNFIAGIAEVFLLAASYSFVSKLIPQEKRGRLFAVYNATIFLSWGVAGTFIAGPIADFFIKKGYGEIISYKVSFMSGIVLLLLGFILLTVTMYEKKKTAKFIVDIGE